ncbi:MAG: hypothetical protein ABEJ95_02095 [Candidatus Nanohalobium sp.]
MSEAVVDSTVLIYLSKIGKLQLLKEEYDSVLIPEEVRREVFGEGKEDDRDDAVEVEKMIGELIEVEKTEIEREIEAYGLEKGENAVLSLARSKEIDKVLIDESAARKLDLKPRGTLLFLLSKTKRGQTDLDGFLKMMEELSDAGFHISEKIYMKAVREAKKMAEE